MLTDILKIIFTISTLSSTAHSTIDGKTYMDPLDIRMKNKQLPGEDPCNPLYWYPRNIPEYCYYRVTNRPEIKPPLTVPLPIPLPFLPLPAPIPPPFFPSPPIPCDIPLAPSGPMLPVGPNPYIQPIHPILNYPLPQPQAAMVPGIPGIVSRDGGINILPFSDVYSDMLEKHKNKMIRRKLERLLDEYEVYPNRKTYRRLKKYRDII